MLTCQPYCECVYTKIHVASAGGYEFGLEIESVLGKSRKRSTTTFHQRDKYSSAFIVFISYLSSHLRI